MSEREQIAFRDWYVKRAMLLFGVELEFISDDVDSYSQLMQKIRTDAEKDLLVFVTEILDELDCKMVDYADKR